MAFFQAVLVLACILAVTTGEVKVAMIGKAFSFPIQRADFFNGTSLLEMVPVEFSPSLIGYPDLPSWLTFVQRNLTEDGYIYGTPNSYTDSNYNLEILAVNKNNYQTSRREVTVSVKPNSNLISYLVLLQIKNFNVEDFYKKQHVRRVENIMRDIWPSGSVYITKVSSLIDEGARKPIPKSQGEKIPKEGILVQVGGTRDFSTPLRQTKIEIESCRHDNDPPVTIKANFPGYNIDWCRYEMIKLPKAVPEPSPEPIAMETDFFFSGDVIAPRDFQTSFICVIVVPSVVIVILVIFFSYLMFARREGVDKRDQMTPEHQLLQFNSIRRATTNLRYLSTRRDNPQWPATSTPVHPAPTPPSSSRADLTSVTDPRSQAPPPYKLPPTYHTDPGDTSRSRSLSRHTEPDHDVSHFPEGEGHVGEEEQLVPTNNNNTHRE